MGAIEISITDEMKERAQQRKHKYKMITNGRDYITPKSNFWAGDDQNQNFISDIGEQCFEQILKNNSIIYQKDKLYMSHGDEFDFKVNGKTIDVKTGHFKHGTFETLPPKYKFFIYKEQLPKPVDYYVHVQVDPDVELAYLIGWITREQALTYPVEKWETMKGPAACIPLDDLLDLSELLNLQDAGKTTAPSVGQLCLDQWLPVVSRESHNYKIS